MIRGSGFVVQSSGLGRSGSGFVVQSSGLDRVIHFNAEP